MSSKKNIIVYVFLGLILLFLGISPIFKTSIGFGYFALTKLTDKLSIPKMKNELAQMKYKNNQFDSVETIETSMGSSSLKIAGILRIKDDPSLIYTYYQETMTGLGFSETTRPPFEVQKRGYLPRRIGLIFTNNKDRNVYINITTVDSNTQQLEVILEKSS